MNKNFRFTFLIACIGAFCCALLISCAEIEPSTPALLTQLEEDPSVLNSDQRGYTEIQETASEVYFSVVYTGDLDEIMLNSSSHFGALIKQYTFQLTDPFVIDEEMKGIVLRLYELPEEPLVLAKEISRCEEVLMVELKNAVPHPL